MAHLLDTNMWSIWLVSSVLGIFQVPLCMSFLGYQVLRTLKLLVVAHCTNQNPLLLVVSRRLSSNNVSINLFFTQFGVEVTALCFGSSSHTDCSVS